MSQAKQRKLVQFNNNQYERIRFLGQGSFGTATVYKRRSDGALVVLKEIDLAKFRSERGRQCALQEARIMSQLDHDNIVRYYQAFTTEARLVIVMEYASLGSLSAYLGVQNKLLAEQEILAIFRQIATGVRYLHSMNIIHLDLKMANVFVTIEGVIKIGDFGFAQFVAPTVGAEGKPAPRVQHPLASDCRRLNLEVKLGHLEAQLQSHQLGTLAYSSPERCLGETIDFKSDIWSLGCILYELISSAPLFASESLSDLVERITRVQYAPIERADISAETRDAFERMISRRPAERPNAIELVDLVNQLLVQCQRASSMGRQLDRRLDINPQRAMAQRMQTDLINTEQLVGRRHLRLNQATANSATGADDLSPSINYPHSLVYQVSLGSRHVRVNRVNLPQTKRIREICKGKSHYLALTYDNIVYGWGNKSLGQLGACGLTSSHSAPTFPNSRGVASSSLASNNKVNDPRKTRSARNSLNLKGDCKLVSLKQQQLEQQPAATSSLSAGSSLASSTQTIVAAPSTPPLPSSGQQMSRFASVEQQQEKSRTSNQRFRKQLVMSMLEKSQPATRPFILNELNNRKIVQVAAGANFSVFLSKTGIVLTCGDSSSGCLGRSSDLKACFTPCMVEALINYDVVSVASGPRHVVAVCGNGHVFAWGKWTWGRLGISPTAINRHRHQAESSDCQSRPSAASSGFHVSRPQLVELPDGVSIKRVHCGDRSTVFIDSNNQCWACGENRSNKLGLDVKRRFQRPLTVECSWTPTLVKSLKKYKIVSCSIGKNHASYLTEAGRLIVCGEDVDRSHKLRTDLIAKEKPRKLLGGTSSGARRLSMSNSALCLNYMRGTGRDCDENAVVTHKRVDPGYLLLDERRLNLKPRESQRDEYLRSLRHELATYETLSDLRLDRPQRLLIDSYLKQSRSLKKMPFESVVSVCCTRKLNLTLTSDNRVYFWGVRSYSSRDGQERATSNALAEHELQLVAGQADECLIKIGPTNSSLMSNIQALGSDQPIIQAQDPQLSAASLEDLWILDYQPDGRLAGISQLDDELLATSTCSSSVSNESSSKASAESGSCSSCASSCESCCCISCSETAADGPSASRLQADLRHDAILKPQPIVSLYVPSTFNQFGCFLSLVNLFCFDEDRFYLVLDTTTRLQALAPMTSFRQSNATPQPALIRQPTPQQPVDGDPCTNRIKSPPIEVKSRVKWNHQACSADNLAARGLAGQTFEGNCQVNPDELQNQRAATRVEGRQVCLNTGDETLACQENNSDEKIFTVDELALGSLDIDKASRSNTTPVDVCSSQGGTSLEEPRSLSTFAATIGDRIIVGPAMNSTDINDSAMQPLSFGQNLSASANCDEKRELDQTAPIRLLRPNAQHRRRLRRITNRSESNTFTGDETEDTSYMPTWVRNEYHNYKCAADQADLEHPAEAQLESASSSSSSSSISDEDTCRSKLTDVTLRGLANSPSNLRMKLECMSMRSAQLSSESGRLVDNQLGDEETSSRQLPVSMGEEKVLSASQPMHLALCHEEPNHRIDGSRNVLRRFSSADIDLVRLTETQGENLLDCSVYQQQTNYSISERGSCGKLAKTSHSTLSSKYGSYNPLIEPTYNSSDDGDALTASRQVRPATPSPEDGDLIVDAPITQCDSFNHSSRKLMLKDSPLLIKNYERSESKFNSGRKEFYRRLIEHDNLISKSIQIDGKALERAIDNPKTVNEDLFSQQSRIKMASCSSINSFRRSLSKICC